MTGQKAWDPRADAALAGWSNRGGPAAPAWRKPARWRHSAATPTAKECARAPPKATATMTRGRPKPLSSTTMMIPKSAASANQQESFSMATHSQSISIAVEGQDLSGTFLSPETKIPGVLFIHGWGGSQKFDLVRARSIAGLGCVCLTFDLRGHAATEAQRSQIGRASCRERVCQYV